MKKVLFEKMTTKTVLYPLMVGGLLFAPCSNVFAEELQSGNSITDSQYQTGFMQRVASLYKSLSGDSSEDYIPQNIIKFATEHKDEGVKTVALSTAELIQLSNEIQVLNSDANASTSLSGESKEEILTKIKEFITEGTAEIVVQEAEKKAAIKPQAEKRAEVKEKLTSAIGETNKTAEICSIIVQTQKGTVESAFGAKSKEAVNELFTLATKEFETVPSVSTNDTTNLNQSVELDTKIKEVVSKIETQVVTDENRKLAAESIVNQAEKQIQEKSATNQTPASAREATINMISRAIENSKDDSSISAGIIQSNQSGNVSSTNELVNLASTALNTSKQISESSDSDRIAALEKSLATVTADFEQKLKVLTNELSSLKGTSNTQSTSSVPSNIPAPPSLGGIPSSSVPTPPSLGGMPTKSKTNNSQTAKTSTIQQQTSQQQQTKTQQSKLTAAEKETKINDLYDNKNRTSQQNDELKQIIKERLSEIGKAKTVIEGLQVKQYNKILTELQQSTTQQANQQQQPAQQQTNQQQPPAKQQQQTTTQQTNQQQKPKQQFELVDEIKALDDKKSLTIEETKQLDQALSDMLKLLDNKKTAKTLTVMDELSKIRYKKMQENTQAELSKSTAPSTTSGSGTSVPGGAGSAGNPANTSASGGGTSVPNNSIPNPPNPGGMPSTSSSANNSIPNPPNPGGMPSTSSSANNSIPNPPNPGGMPSTTSSANNSIPNPPNPGGMPSTTSSANNSIPNSPNPGGMPSTSANNNIPNPPNPGGMPSTKTGDASAGGAGPSAAANASGDPAKASEKPKDLLDEIKNFNKDSLKKTTTEEKKEEKTEESKPKSWEDQLAEKLASRRQAIEGDDEDVGDENNDESDSNSDDEFSLDKELSDSDSEVRPTSNIDWSLARIEYLKKEIDRVNYEAFAKAVERADTKKISEITKSINAADTAVQKGDKEQITSMAIGAIKTTAENIKSYTPYWTAAELAKQYLSTNATEAIPESMTEEGIKKVCVINYLYAQNVASDAIAKNSASGVVVNVDDINDNDIVESAKIIKALCKKLNQDGLVPSADYFDSLIYKKGTDKELDKDNIKRIMELSSSMAKAEKEYQAGHAKMVNEITSVPSNIMDPNQIEAWKEILKKYYSIL